MAMQAAELRYAVRFKAIFKYFGQLCLVLSIFSLVPLILSIILGEINISVRYGIVVGGLIIIGLPLAKMQAPSKLQVNEGIIIITLLYLVTSLIMSYPMMTFGMTFIDALFESVSGLTTTGLSTLSSLENVPKTFLFARAWMQWYGGLGIVAFSLALIIRPGVVAKSLAGNEDNSDDLVGGTRVHARLTIGIYSILTLVGFVGCLVLGVTPFTAIRYIMAAVSTGGFAPRDSSLSTLGLPAQYWISFVCLSGALPLTFYRFMPVKKRLQSMQYLQFKTIILFVFLSSIVIASIMLLNSEKTWSQVLHHAPILALSAQSTAGFSSISCENLHSGIKIVLMFSMLTGGSLGSTAGGIKLFRLLIVMGQLRLILLRTCLPKHSVIVARLNGQKLHVEEIEMAQLLIIIFVGVVVLSWFPFVILGHDPLDSLFEVVSALGTVGLSVGITSTDLPTVLKGVLCFDMLMGRLEIFAWIVLLYPGTWFGRKMEDR